MSNWKLAGGEDAKYKSQYSVRMSTFLKHTVDFLGEDMIGGIEAEEYDIDPDLSIDYNGEDNWWIATRYV